MRNDDSFGADARRPGTRARHAVGRVGAVVALALLVGACTQVDPRTSDVAAGASVEGEGTDRVLLMPADVKLYEKLASGMTEPRADWSRTARANVRRALRGELRERGRDLVRYRGPPGDVRIVHDRHQQTVKLHEVVARAVKRHGYRDGFALPTKRGPLDWTLGEGVDPLAADYDADRALFLVFRDSFSTEGRVAMMVVGALLGVGVSGGQQVGTASLVDLETGNVVWFNQLRSTTGDLRDPAKARAAVETLLTDAPL